MPPTDEQISKRKEYNKQFRGLWKKNDPLGFLEYNRKAQQAWRDRQLLLRQSDPKVARKLWAKKNPELAPAERKKRNCERVLRYYKLHPEVGRRNAHLRRARKASARIGDSAPIAKWEKAWRSRKRVTCFWCLEQFKPEKCHSDHIIPLSKGGSHAIENLCISCQSCNSHKSAKLLGAWNAVLAEPVLL